MKISVVSGGFDPIHSGHISYLKDAKSYGEILVVAITERDVIVVQNLVLLYGLIWTFINVAVDLTYAWLDPRIRYE